MMNRPALQLKSILAEDQQNSEENWMLSYIDVFVLMTTLFIMLVVINKPAPQEAPQMVEQVEILDLPEDVIALVEAPLPDHQAWIENIETAIDSNELGNLVQLKKSEDFTELEISSRVLFDSGDAELTRPGEAVLENLLPILRSTTGDVFIEGHTDDQPIETSRFPSNWELASARATEVLQFFVSEGLARERFRAVSYADTKPIVPNNSAKNRGKNRRVSLVIHR